MCLPDLTARASLKGDHSAIADVCRLTVERLDYTEFECLEPIVDSPARLNENAPDTEHGE
jgi:hypothetical protein